ncbi:MAG: hypothetical protein Q9M43_15390 [Sulfurimonas sp.]|nr:hypothetical protein [Sulfurimonas sp.]
MLLKISKKQKIIFFILFILLSIFIIIINKPDKPLPIQPEIKKEKKVLKAIPKVHTQIKEKPQVKKQKTIKKTRLRC